jgi:hypothetical protein
MHTKKIPRRGSRIVGIKQEKEGGKRQKPKGASKTIKPQSKFYAETHYRQNKINLIMTYPAAERSLWRIPFMQGAHCWSENKFDQNPTGNAEYIHSLPASQESFSFSS